jgi:DNA-binding NtrC family response regulator
VAATHRNLEQAVASGAFREDLYYRLKSVQIELPPLSERGDDVSLLADYFLNILRRAGRTPISRISDDALSCLRSYDWPGNARELENCIEAAVLKAKLSNANAEVIESNHLPSEVRSGRSAVRVETDISVKDLPETGFDIDEALAKVELMYIEKARKKKAGRVADASRILGYHDRFTMRRRIDNIFARFPDLAHQFEKLKP